MHIHEEPLHADSPPAAAQTRVTPEEFAAAVARIEARKDAGQRHLEGTIPIGEAVRQLGLDATPEEVLAEVQAARTAQSTVATQGSVTETQSGAGMRRLSPSLRLSLLLSAGVMMAGLALGTVSHHGSSQDSSPSPVMMTTPPVPTDFGLADLRADQARLQVGDASGRLRMLSEVGDNQVVYSLLNLSGPSFEDYSPANAPVGPNQAWRLVKHRGKVYVRGWTERVSDQVIRDKGMDIASYKMPGYDIPVTLPLDGFQIHRNIGVYEVMNFHADHVQLDKHAWEKWPPKQ